MCDGTTVPADPAGAPVSPAVSRASRACKPFMAASSTPPEKKGMVLYAWTDVADFGPLALASSGMRAGRNWPLAACTMTLSFAAAGSTEVVALRAPAAAASTPTKAKVLRVRKVSLPIARLFQWCRAREDDSMDRLAGASGVDSLPKGKAEERLTPVKPNRSIVNF